ncbi:MerR family transcriptional regulator [Actibacterium sp. MT2.3-13A]|uniref:MerR family transcriptional regulator n=1 Tax=Actibacterium sp. MT2.3-13A TaxID=2828332 RepID=UPI002010F945|nr:MerR family transcriptional regulator [Actibacterium sp. MT2.3-13A]
MGKSPDAFRTISEVSEWLETPAHVLRFWESRFTQVKPVKRAGGRRYYRPSDMLLLGGIKKLLHEEGMTIRGVQKILREQGVKHVAALSQPLDGAGQAEAEAAIAPPSAPDSAPPAGPERESPAAAPAPQAEAPGPTPQAPASQAASGVRPSNVVPLSPLVPQLDLFAEGVPEAAESEPEAAAARPAAHEPGARRPAPLGADLPAADPADDSLPAEPGLRARLRDPARARHLATRHPAALTAALARLSDLRDRFGKGE